MRKFVLFLIFLPGLLTAQELKTKKVEGFNFTEVYHYDKKSREYSGEYFKIGKQKGDTLIKGQYNSGARVGEWMYFEPDNKPLVRFDYTSDSCTWLSESINRPDTFLVKVDEGDFVKRKVDRRPVLLGHKNEDRTRFAKEFVVTQSLMNIARPQIYVGEFVVGKDGRVTEVNSDGIPDKSFQQQFQKCFERYEWRYLPALYNGAAVESKFLVVYLIKPSGSNIAGPMQKGSYILDVEIQTQVATTTRVVTTTGPSGGQSGYSGQRRVVY